MPVVGHLLRRSGSGPRARARSCRPRRARWWPDRGRSPRRRRARSRPPRSRRSGSRARPGWTPDPGRTRPRRRPPVERPFSLSDLLQRVVDLGADPEAVREGRRARRDDHELLEVDRVVGVGAAVDHVHHRDREHVSGTGVLGARRRVEAAEVVVERLPGVGGRGLGDRQRDARGSRWRRAGPCWACRPARSWSGRAPIGRRRARPAMRVSDLAVDVARRPSDALAAALSPPSRSSTASYSPVEAPEGTTAASRGRRSRGRPRPRPSGCPASRGPAARERSRWSPWGREAIDRRRRGAGWPGGERARDRRRGCWEALTASRSSSPTRRSASSRSPDRTSVRRASRPPPSPPDRSGAAPCARRAATAGSRAAPRAQPVPSTSRLISSHWARTWPAVSKSRSP